ncbi:iron transporter [Micromonospora sp. CPCC 206061]|uniref:iron transporter n=1 Tax=Micromonospora sp. CPCC 206061 TaxID=3122410 RepID=UPI002FF26176
MKDAATPPMRPSNEATKRQRDIAAVQGEAYRLAVEAMAVENGIRETRAGGYVIGFTTEAAEGAYTPQDRQLARAEPAGANTHMEVIVADGSDGRFVPQLDVTVTVLTDGRQLFTTAVPFLWHPFLYHYGINAEVPGEGPFDVTVRIQPPDFMRHDPVNGQRFAEPAEAAFTQVRFNTGVKRSPDVSPHAGTVPEASH